LIVWKGKLYFNREDVNLLKKEERYVRRRYEAVAFCLQPVSPMTRSEAAERYGVSERTVKRWIKRYRTGGIPGLRKTSTRPHKIERKVTPQDEALIVELRKRTGLGPRRIWELLKASRADQPHRESYSPTTIRNVLVRTNTVKVRKREKKSFKSFDWENPLNCAQMDLTELDDGQTILIVIDDHSRRRWGTVLEEAKDDQIYDWMEGNVPRFEHLLTDNGVQMDRTNRRAAQYCAEHGTKHIWASVHHPQTLGKISRAQKELKAALRASGYSSREDLERKTRAFLEFENHCVNRITLQTPYERFGVPPDGSWLEEFAEAFKLQDILPTNSKGDKCP